MEIRVKKTDQVAEFLTAHGWTYGGDCINSIDPDIYTVDIPTKRYMSGTAYPTLYYVPYDIFKEFTVLYTASYEAANQYLQEYFND